MLCSTMKLDLFESAYVPDWPMQLQALHEMALPEAWTFKDAPTEKMLKENYVLERYIFSVFRNQVMYAQHATSDDAADQYFHVRSGYACFHTGLVTRHYKPIYCFFERNDYGYSYEWRMRGFFDDTSVQMRKVELLPQKPFFDLMPEQWGFAPTLPVRVNVDHILASPDNMLRIPDAVRGFPNLYMLLQAGVEIARRTAELIPSLVVPQMYQGKVQFLLPICLTDPNKTDLAMAITPMETYYLGSTCLTPHMAYSNARLLARPLVPWLTELVK